MPRNDAHERGIVEAFIRPELRERYATLLAHPKRRASITARLASIKDIEPRCLIPIAPAEQTTSAVLASLRKRGAPATCYVISRDDDLDARELPLEDALTATLGEGNATLISCIAGKLGFIEAESTTDRYLLVHA